MFLLTTLSSLDLTLANEKYTGVYLYSPQMEENRGKRREKPNAIRIENALPVIIDRAIFMEVQAIMNERKQTGRKADYLCSGLVYCRCGAKMHVLKTRRKGHEYIYYACSEKCGAHTLRMEDVDRAAIKYLHDLLSEDNQRSIAKAMREYQAGEGSRMEEFKAVLRKRIGEKQRQYDALMKNLSSGELPNQVVADIGAQMKQLKGEIAALEATKPPKDFTVEQIGAWLEAIKAAPDEEAVHLLIERIEKKEDGFHAKSTLEAVLGKSGCGGRI